MLVERILQAPTDVVAAVDSHGQSITYGKLRDSAQSLVNRLGTSPRLVLLEGASTVEWLICYVACLLGRHPVLIAPADSESTFSRLRDTFSPDVLLKAHDHYEPVFEPQAQPKTLHPELAVMLSTSGSTGSAKCVRLSRGNIAANAQSICEYLEIGSDERGVVNLPTHYSYGLSVVNSHLFAQATLLMTDQSVIEPAFWEFLRSHAATSFQGVPHVYELLSRVDCAAEAPRSLRYFTQAGGRLDAEKVIKFNSLAREHGWRFYVMYGQTEATARMAFVPPAQLEAHPGSIGIAIPGGRFSLLGEQGEITTPGEVGELVYEGPNVMMGYATNSDELALGPMPARLSTGDLASVDEDGYYTIAGRLSRFVKIFGNRIGLDDVERILSTLGMSAVATGVDDHLLVVTTDDKRQAEIGALIAARLKLPQQYFSVRAVKEYPRLPTGKLDYQSLKNSIQPKASVRAKRGGLRGLFAPSKSRNASSVSEVFFNALGEAAQDQSANFRTLGGDSLTYVSVALGLESVLGQLPKDWDTKSIAELSTLEGRFTPSSTQGTRRMLDNLDTLRALACVMVVAYHVVGLPNSGLRQTHGFWRWSVDSFDYIRMPLFTAMAGFFYAAIPIDREGLARFLQRRFSMLMIPALSVTPIYWAVRRLVYGVNEPLLAELVSGYLHLWYLYALMVMLALSGVVDVVIKPKAWVWALFVPIAPILSVHLPYVDAFCISKALRLFCFFALGVTLYRIPALLGHRGLLLAAGLGATAALTAQQVGMWNSGVGFTHFKYWEFVGGVSCVVVMLKVFPRMGALEAIGAYSYTIYLWHPMVNAGVRFLLGRLHVTNLLVLFVVGLVVATLVPIAMHRFVHRYARFALFSWGADVHRPVNQPASRG